MVPPWSASLLAENSGNHTGCPAVTITGGYAPVVSSRRGGVTLSQLLVRLTIPLTNAPLMFHRWLPIGQGKGIHYDRANYHLVLWFDLTCINRTPNQLCSGSIPEDTLVGCREPQSLPCKTPQHPRAGSRKPALLQRKRGSPRRRALHVGRRNREEEDRRAHVLIRLFPKVAEARRLEVLLAYLVHTVNARD